MRILKRLGFLTIIYNFHRRHFLVLTSLWNAPGFQSSALVSKSHVCVVGIVLMMCIILCSKVRPKWRCSKVTLRSVFQSDPATINAHTHKFLVYLYLSIYAHFLTVFHVLTWKKMGFLKAVQPRPPAIHRPLPPAGAQPPWVSPRTMPGAVSPRTMPGAVSPRMAVPSPRTASPRMGKGKCIVSISFNGKIHEFPLHQLPFFFLLFGNQAAKRVGCPDAGPDAAADAVAAAADVREGLRVVYAKLGG